MEEYMDEGNMRGVMEEYMDEGNMRERWRSIWMRVT